MNEKLKSLLLNDQVFYGFVVVLVALASFGLGRASALETRSISEENLIPATSEVSETILSRVSASATVIATPPADRGVGQLVASKSGTKYHSVTCPGAKQIKEENKIYFASVAEATAAGYKPAANCPEVQ